MSLQGNSGAWKRLPSAKQTSQSHSKATPRKRAKTKGVRSRATIRGGKKCSACSENAVGRRVLIDTISIGQTHNAAEVQSICISCTPQECMIRGCNERAIRVLDHQWSVAQLQVDNDLWFCERHVEAVRIPRLLGGWGKLALSVGGLALVIGFVYTLVADRPSEAALGMMQLAMYGGGVVMILGGVLFAWSKQRQWSGSLGSLALRKKPQYESTFKTNRGVYRDSSFDF